MNETTVFKSGDRVYDHQAESWGTIKGVGITNLEVRFDNMEIDSFLPFTIADKNLSFTEYNYVTGGFSQERPKWYENMTIDQMLDIKYVKITEYTGYWRVGDIVKVTDYNIDTKKKRVDLFLLDGTQRSAPERCEPSTEDEYKAFKSNK